MTPEEMIQYSWIVSRTKRAHHGGNRWIGTGGTSPAAIRFSPGGYRVGVRSTNKSAQQVAMERRYRDITGRPPTESQMAEALKKLRR